MKYPIIFILMVLASCTPQKERSLWRKKQGRCAMRILEKSAGRPKNYYRIRILENETNKNYKSITKSNE